MTSIRNARLIAVREVFISNHDYLLLRILKNAGRLEEPTGRGKYLLHVDCYLVCSLAVDCKYHRRFAKALQVRRQLYVDLIQTWEVRLCGGKCHYGIVAADRALDVIERAAIADPGAIERDVHVAQLRVDRNRLA